MRDDIGAGAFKFGHQRGQIRRARRIAFPQDDLQARLLGELLARLRHSDPIWSILVNDRDLHILWLEAELRFGIFHEKRDERLAVLIGVDLGAEHVLAILVPEHGGGDGRGDPKNLLLCLHFGGERHRVRAGIDTEDDFDLLLIDQALDLVDRGISLAL